MTKRVEQKSMKNIDVDRFVQLYEIISKSTYTKRSAQLLKSLIDDMKQQKMILLYSKKNNRKVHFVNQLFGKQLLQTSHPSMSYSTSIIQYGPKEEIVGHFLDGQVEHFTLDKLPLFHTDLNEGTEILQQGVDYLDIFLEHHLLQNFTLIDVGTIETSEKFMYVSPSALKRADDILWLIDDEDELTIGEIRLIERMKQMGFSPLAITRNEQTTISSNLFRNCLNEKEDTAIYLELLDKKTFQKQHEKKAIERFVQWVERFEIEVSNLLKREPYIGAYTQLMTIVKHPELENKTPVGDLQIEVTHMVKQYESIQTLYQFVQFVRHHAFITDEKVLRFSMISNRYMEAVHHYRAVVKEYQKEVIELETMQRKMKSKLLLPFLPKDLDKKVERVTAELVEKYEDIQNTLKKIERLEKQLTHDLEKTNESLYQNIHAEMAQYELENKVQKPKKTYKTRRFTAIQRLKGFDSIVEAKKILQPFLVQLQENSKQLLDDNMLLRLEKVTKRLNLLPLDYEKLLIDINKIPDVDTNQHVVSVPNIIKNQLTSEQIILEIDKNVVI